MNQIFLILSFLNSASLKDKINDSTDIISFGIDSSYGFEIGISDLNGGIFQGTELIGWKASEFQFFEFQEGSKTFNLGIYEKLYFDKFNSDKPSHILRKKIILFQMKNKFMMFPKIIMAE